MSVRLWATALSVLVGLAVAVLPHTYFWTNEGLPYRSAPLVWLPVMLPGQTATYLAQGVIAAILAFVAVAALRWAWLTLGGSSVGQPHR